MALLMKEGVEEDRQNTEKGMSSRGRWGGG
jgi:hypothetical protein